VHLDWQQLRCWNEFDIHRLPPIHSMPAEFKPLWKTALGSSDRELRRDAILAIGEAHKGGYLDFSDLKDDLRAILNRDDIRTETRIDAARTLVILNARSAAADLMKHSGTAPELRQIAERAFATWDYKPARDMWMSRVKTPAAVPRSHLILAIRGLAALGHKEAAGPVRKIVVSSQVNATTRLAAARGLAELQTSGLEDSASQLLSDKTRGVIPALLAATLLRHHSGDTAEAILLKLMEHSSTAIVAKAWVRLDELNPNRISDVVLSEGLRSPDAQVRLLAVQSCSHRSNAHVDELIFALDDHHPDVRCQARHALLDQAGRSKKGADLDTVEEIQTLATLVLLTESWRGVEQACLLVAELDHKLAVDALVNLLQHPRDEVASAAAYAMKELAVPEMLPKLLEHAMQIDARLWALGPAITWRTELIQPHLFEAFAELKYQPAENLMREYVPKKELLLGTPHSRSSAIWSLAYLHEGDADLQLAKQFSARMLDRAPVPAESLEVFGASATALGIMKADASLGDLRKFAAEFGPDDRSGRAAFWSINILTGEPIPPKKRGTKSRGQWFLSPLSRD
jgi:HEAT repeat protein